MNIDGIIEDYPNASTELNKATFTNLANAILNAVCPIGKTEIFYDNNDHSEYLGFEWERTSVGRAIVGIDESQSEFNEVGKTGGTKTHTLTINEMPSHNHQLPGDAGSGSDYTIQYIGSKLKTFTNVYSNSKGGGQAHNNLQPYEVFAIWKRVA